MGFFIFFWEGGSIDRLECKLKERVGRRRGVGTGRGGFAVSGGGVGLVVSGDLERERLLRVARARASKKWVVGSGLWVVGMGELRGLGFGVWVLSFGFWVLVRRGVGGGGRRGSGSGSGRAALLVWTRVNEGWLWGDGSWVSG